ncbi:uncharacterized protein MYCFIDRAFT_173128 [Pseudocercospora fijiensis CIRAD86]|uniref:Uncharacterized protein n=1 Tax=Pseudocercospora fijiensis (strain CIRAD86) TaxID=383855 RepID=M3B3Y5_PSEFD|nr:uncharacterized protein MYCFIDRAFT_173128 [Pseudocercospora fijiensis CIRAD86]EME84077.1 hypothetical protein MYCFIDRAFT_173128 [Pseudocercospora fijiensis CIRAD86]
MSGISITIGKRILILVDMRILIRVLLDIFVLIDVLNRRGEETKPPWPRLWLRQDSLALYSRFALPNIEDAVKFHYRSTLSFEALRGNIVGRAGIGSKGTRRLL